MTKVNPDLAKFEYFRITFCGPERMISFYLNESKSSFICETTCKHLLDLADTGGSEGPDTNMCEELGSERLMLKFKIGEMCKKSELFNKFPDFSIKQYNSLYLINLFRSMESVVYKQAPPISEDEKAKLLKDFAEHSAKFAIKLMPDEFRSEVISVNEIISITEIYTTDNCRQFNVLTCNDNVSFHNILNTKWLPKLGEIGPDKTKVTLIEIYPDLYQRTLFKVLVYYSANKVH